MDWQDKAAALDALAEIGIRIRKPGDWYVHQLVEIKDEHILCGEYGNGESPEEAIEDHWKHLVDNIAQSPKYLVVRAYGGHERRAVKWNGYMWREVSEPKSSTQAE